MNTKNMETSRSFKIRRGANKSRTQQELYDQEYVANLHDLRLAENHDQDQEQQPQQMEKTINASVYLEDEENINCYRFPHSTFCGCDNNCMLESF